MVIIRINRKNHTFVQSFAMSGHAESGPYGQDLVCAAVSAVSIGTINAIHTLTGVNLVTDIEEDGGFIRCDVPNNLSKETFDNVQLLLEGMIVSLKSIEEEYGKFIQIKEN
ncbi:ribosomal-processing cysteine protease Prp [Massilibacterium senegalense]|uniref:ribosomal-processing cysteine protease Prp n=1 Tax=Massilibacterium senegalense TaxID=1632858 RepID=UPI000785331A|nr:ribosomal-processing cysteine protease Prp [Massilibacterium senegalense]